MSWHGFHIGINNVTVTKVIKWRHGRPLCWIDFIEYLKQYFDIPDYGDNWFKVLIKSEKHVQLLYLKVKEFD